MNKTSFRILTVLLVSLFFAYTFLADSPIANGSPKKIELFVTSWCPYCKVAEKTLRMRGLQYTRYDIEHDSEGMKKYNELGAGGVPIFRIDGQIIRGFNLDALNAILGSGREPPREASSKAGSSL